MVTGLLVVAFYAAGVAAGIFIKSRSSVAEIEQLRNQLGQAVLDRSELRTKLEREIAELNTNLGKRSAEVMELRKRIAKAETTNAALREELTTNASNIADQKKFLGDLSAKFGTIAEKL